MARHVHIILMNYLCAYDGNVKGVKEVEGQRGHQIHKEPGGGVMDADGAGVVNHLSGLAHVGGAEV